MKILSLGGLPVPPGWAFQAPDRPLVLPAWLPAAHREQSFAAWKGLVGPTLPVVEVELHRRPRESLARLLARTADDRGGSGLILLVRVVEPGVDLARLEEPAFQPFRWRAVLCDHRAEGLRLGHLGELLRFVIDLAAEEYHRLVPRLGLRPAAWGEIEGWLSLFWDPVVVVDAVNHLVEVQVEGLVAPRQARAVRRRLLGQLLAARPAAELLALCGLAAGRLEAAQALLGHDGEEAAARLREEGLWLDGEAHGWGLWLREPALVGPLFLPGGGLPSPAQLREQPKLETAAKWVAAAAPPEPMPSARRLDEVLPALWEGDLAGARALLDEAAEHLDGVDDALWRCRFWRLLGHLRRAEGRPAEAEDGFRRALAEAEAPAGTRGVVADDLARLLCDQGRWPGAEPLFREALRLQEEGRASPTWRGITLSELARGLRDNGRWPEAEPLFREALRLKEEGRASPRERGITLAHLAIGLCDQGRWAEAEPLFREAVALLGAGPDGANHAKALDAWARGCARNGDPARAARLRLRAAAVRRGAPDPGD